MVDFTGGEKTIRKNLTYQAKTLIIQMLRNGDLPVDLLWKDVSAFQQRHRDALTPQSKSTFNYWLKELASFHIIEEYLGEIRLTKIGNWVAKAPNEMIEERIEFVRSVMCKQCSVRDLISLRLPESKNDMFDVTKSNRKIYFVCPKCQNGQSVSGFSNNRLDFYRGLAGTLGINAGF